MKKIDIAKAAACSSGMHPLLENFFINQSLPKKINLKPKPKIIPKSEPSKNNFSFYINCIGILILIIGSLILYQRLMDKQSIEYQKQNTIL